MNSPHLTILMVMEANGGVLTHVEGIIHFLLANNCLVHLAYSDIRKSDRLEELLVRLQNAGGQVLNLRVSNRPQIRDFGAFLALRKMIQRLRPDIIHAHSSKAGGLARTLAIFRERRPLFYTPNAYYGMTYRRNRSPYHHIERFLGKYGVTINVSNDEKRFANEILDISPERQRLIFNSVDLQQFCPPTEEEAVRARESLGLPENAVVLGTIARLTWQKDPETLYRAFAKVIVDHPDVVLLHVGDGKKSLEMKELARELGIADKIYRIDYLRDPRPVYHAIDAFLLGSRFEGLSFAILEALACGRPIIISDALGNRDFARLGLSHFWDSKKEEPDDFARAITEFLHSKKLGQPCNHRDMIKTWFNSEKQHLSLLNVYRQALESASPSHANS